MIADIRKPCKACPFDQLSGYAYDEDAMEALDSGMTPSCHCIVGRDAIFHDETPSERTVCVGHERWMSDVPGWCKPILLTHSEPQVSGNGGPFGAPS